MKSPKLVLVEWIDACHAPSGWQFGNQPQVDFEPVYSIGFLIQKKKKGILLAQTWFPGDYANVIAIPKGMIKKITTLGHVK
jgi:hypothetical protein